MLCSCASRCPSWSEGSETLPTQFPPRLAAPAFANEVNATSSLSACCCRRTGRPGDHKVLCRPDRGVCSPGGIKGVPKATARNAQYCCPPHVTHEVAPKERIQYGLPGECGNDLRCNSHCTQPHCQPTWPNKADEATSLSQNVSDDILRCPTWWKRVATACSSTQGRMVAVAALAPRGLSVLRASLRPMVQC